MFAVVSITCFEVTFLKYATRLEKVVYLGMNEKNISGGDSLSKPEIKKFNLVFEQGLGQLGKNLNDYKVVRATDTLSGRVLYVWSSSTAKNNSVWKALKERAADIFKADTLSINLIHGMVAGSAWAGDFGYHPSGETEEWAESAIARGPG
jgi:hypothetical protein